MVNLVIAPKYFETMSVHQKNWEQIQKKIQEDTSLREQITTFLITTNDGLADIVKAGNSTTTLLRGAGFYTEELHFPQDT